MVFWYPMDTLRDKKTSRKNYGLLEKHHGKK